MTPAHGTSSDFSLEPLNRYLKSLYDANWEDIHGVIRFSADLKLAELAHSVFFQNARIFLQALLEAGGTSATATGNLNRALVGQVLDRLVLGKTYKESLLHVCKVINEMDLWPLHEVRIVTEFKKLVAKRKKRFVVTRQGRELLSDDRAGELFRQLFLTYFHKLDLCYFVGVREVPEIQQTLAITIWRLAQVAADWREVKDIGQEILPPRVTKLIRAAQISTLDDEDWLVCSYVLSRFLDFGLIECKRESEWSVCEKDIIRVTPLFRRFISFAPIPLHAFATNQIPWLFVFMTVWFAVRLTTS